jgi:chromosome segregation ATPase
MVSQAMYARCAYYILAFQVLPKFTAMRDRLAERDHHINLLKAWRAESEKTMTSQEQELSNLRSQLSNVRAQLAEATEKIQTQTSVHLEVSRQLDESRKKEKELERDVADAALREEELKKQLEAAKEKHLRDDQLLKSMSKWDTNSNSEARSTDSRRLVAEIGAANRTMQVRVTHNMWLCIRMYVCLCLYVCERVPQR